MKLIVAYDTQAEEAQDGGLPDMSIAEPDDPNDVTEVSMGNRILEALAHNVAEQ